MREPARRLLVVILLAHVCIAAHPRAAAAERIAIDRVLDALAAAHNFQQTAIAPDGRRVAWVETLEGAPAASAIYVRDLPSGSPRRITAASGGRNTRERGIAWSPDGRSLAFLSDAATPGQLQIFAVDVTGRAAPRQVTRVTGQVAAPRWSPDGRQIAFLYVAGSAQETGALVAYKPDAGAVGETVEEQRIAIADAASGSVREVSPANLFVYDYDWSPDGKAFAAEAAEGSGTNNYWVARLYVVPAEGGAARVLWKPPLQIAVPRWSPDGRTIAVIHGLMSDEGANGGDIFVVPAEGGGARNLTPNLDGSARTIGWRANGDLVMDELSDGQAALVAVAPGGERRTLWSAPQQLSSVSIATQGDGVSAIVQSFSAAPDVYAGPAGQWTRQSNVNAAIEPFWGDARSLHWTSDTFRVQGWLLYPRDFDPSRRYPMVVSVHGGPSAANMAGWPTRWNAVLPSQDYFVLLPNPRGSFGQGEAFTQANVKDFGYGDLRDILGGVDAAVQAAPIDPERVGITGWSYGGYMTMWAVTQTNRFKAAVAGAGIASWQSYYGQNRIDTWMLPFFGASVYDDPEIYARSSPITFIRNAKTPTLVLHGDRDSEVPTPQGYEFWHALKALGVPTELVIYENEGHGISKPEHVRDIEKRLVGWFDKYLK